MTATDLSTEVQALRDELEALRAERTAPSLAMRVFQAGPYLGQGATLIVSVANADGTPIGGAPLTLVATSGELRSDDGVERGNSIVVETSPDGTARVSLRAPLPDGMDAEQAAFDSAIRGLNPAARTPADDAAGLANLAGQYGWEANQDLRNAIDEYLKEFGKGLPEAIAVRDFLHAWLPYPATVVAYLTEDQADGGAGRTVLRAATITLTFRNWLGAFLQTALQLSEAGSNLGQDLDLMTRLGASATGIVEGIYSRTRNYQATQFGKVGELVASRVADNSIRGVLDAGVGTASGEINRSVAQALEAGRSAIRGAGAGAAVHLGIAAATVSSKADVSALEGLRSDVTTTLAGKAETVAVDKVRADLTLSIAAKADTAALATKSDATAVDKVRSDLTLSIATKADTVAVDKLRADVTGAIATKADLTALAAKADATAVDKVRSDLTLSISTKADTVTVDKLRTDVTGAIAAKADLTALAAKADATAVDKVRSDLTLSIAAKADTVTVDKLRTDVTSSIATKADTVAVDKLRTDVTGAIAAKADLTALAAKADATAVDKVRSDLTTSIAAKADIAALAAKADTTAVDKVRSDLTISIATKADTTALAAKADTTVVDKVRSDLTASIANKADTAVVDKLRSDFTVSIAAKADAAAVDKLKTDLSLSIAAKADATALEKLRTDVNTSFADLRKQVTVKADVTALQSLQNQVATKADVTVVDTLRTDLTTRLNAKVDTTTFESRISTIQRNPPAGGL